MKEVIIESSSNKIIKEIKSLGIKKNRWQKKQFIMEGIKGIEQALNSDYKIRNIIYTTTLDKNKRGVKLLNRSIKENIKTVLVTDKVFRELSKIENPQWIIAVVDFNLKTIEDIPEKENTLVYFDNIQDPGNMGTMIRTSEAIGGTGIIFTGGSVDIYSHKVVQASMGAILDIPIYYLENIEKGIEFLKNKGIKILTTTLNTENYVFTNKITENICIVMGNEGNGVSEEIINNSDELIKIPIVGKAESLNVGIALGIILYENLRIKFIEK